HRLRPRSTLFPYTTLFRSAEGNVTPAAEFNVWADPEAAKRVFASGLDLTMVGLDVTHKALVGAEHKERLRAAGRVGRTVAELLRSEEHTSELQSRFDLVCR